MFYNERRGSMTNREETSSASASRDGLDEAAGLRRALLSRLETDYADPENHLALARFYLDLHRYEEAVSPLRTASALRPDRNDILLLLARAYMGTGRADMAEVCCRRILGDNPNDPDASVMLASILEGRGEHEEAGGLLSRAARMNPSHAEVLLHAARHNLEHGSLEKAAVYAERAEKAAAGNHELRKETLEVLIEAHSRAGRMDRAIDALGRLSRSQENDPWISVRRVELMLRERMWPEAVEEARGVARRLNPRNERSRKALARIHLLEAGAWREEGDIPAALTALEKARRYCLPHEHILVEMEAALCHVAAADTENCTRSCGKALQLLAETKRNPEARGEDTDVLGLPLHELDGTMDLACAEVASILSASGKPEEAVALCRRAFELGFTGWRITLQAAGALAALSRPEEALAMYDRALEHAPSPADVLYEKGMLLLKLDSRQEEAVATLRRAARAGRNDLDEETIARLTRRERARRRAVEYTGKAKERLRARELENALGWCRKAASLDPANAEAWRLLSELELYACNTGKAMEALARASVLSPEAGSDLERLVWLTYCENRLEEAERAIEELIRRTPAERRWIHRIFSMRIKRQRFFFGTWPIENFKRMEDAVLQALTPKRHRKPSRGAVLEAAALYLVLGSLFMPRSEWYERFSGLLEQAGEDSGGNCGESAGLELALRLEAARTADDGNEFVSRARSLRHPSAAPLLGEVDTWGVETALRNLELLCGATPGNGEALWLKATLLAAHGEERLSSRLEFLRKAAASSEAGPEIFLELACMLAAAAPRDPAMHKRARAALNKAARLYGGSNPSVVIVACRIEEKTGNEVRVLPMLLEALKRTPSYAPVRRELGLRLISSEDAGGQARGLSLLRSAICLDPNEWQAIRGLAHYWKGKEEDEEVLSLVTKLKECMCTPWSEGKEASLLLR